MSQRSYLVRLEAVLPSISPGCLWRGVTPPCLGFSAGPTRTGPLSLCLRSDLESKRAQIMPECPNSPLPAAVQPALARAASGAVGHQPAFDSAHVPHTLDPFLASLGAISSRIHHKCCLNALTLPTLERCDSSMPWIGSRSYALGPFLSISRTIWSRKGPKYCLNALTLFAQQPSSPA